MTDDDTYTAPEVLRLTGLTYRQLDYWIRSGYIAPSQRDVGSGGRRRFTRDEVAAIIYVADHVRYVEALSERLSSGELWDEAMSKAGA